MKKKILKILCIILITICICSICYATFTDIDYDESLFDSEINNNCNTSIIGASITILQLLLFFGSISIFSISIVKAIYINFKLKELQKDINLQNEEKIKLYEEKKLKIKKTLCIYIVIAIIMYVIQGIIGITKNMAMKPIIYIYPNEEIEVSVKLKYPEKLTCSYPKYEVEGWKVIANPNGMLKDIKTGRELYSLYWEGINHNKIDSKLKDGFVINGEDSAKFLEEKLEILGLNEKEAEEFIIYWLPKLESNKYNYIRFETIQEINNNMPLEITPIPDTLIRVMMEFKGLKLPIKVDEQELEKVERKGYTVVEWGGTEI